MIERLQKIISSAGLMSRRAAEECIAAGRVSVNGVTAVLGTKADADNDLILVDGKVLPSAGEKLYIMLNKPKGYVTTLSDDKGRKDVSELVQELGTRLYPVGRLDMNSEGLLIMTNDGDFANTLMHPSHNFSKTYHTWVRGEDIEKKLAALRAPMDIDGYITSPAKVQLLQQFPGSAVLSISIQEGRNRQVRKMCAQLELEVTRLRRVAEGPLQLGDLKSGAWRKLSPHEIRQVFK